jgi:hypothetical protein
VCDWISGVGEHKNYCRLSTHFGESARALALVLGRGGTETRMRIKTKYRHGILLCSRCISFKSVISTSLQRP